MPVSAAIASRDAADWWRIASLRRRPPPHDNTGESQDVDFISGNVGRIFFSISGNVGRIFHKKGTQRDVFLGWVERWDDTAEEFLVTFGEKQPVFVTMPERPFVLHSEGRTHKRAVKLARANQARFKFDVRARYGLVCAVCPVAVPKVLEAAHIYEVKDGGSDDPRNGLVLCPTHHRAFDAGLFAVDPQTTTLVYQPNGPNKEDLRITRNDLRHLP